MTDTPPESSTTDLSFDAALARLDEVVRRLEDGSVELEEAIHLFEEGDAVRGTVPRAPQRRSGPNRGAHRNRSADAPTGRRGRERRRGILRTLLTSPLAEQVSDAASGGRARSQRVSSGGRAKDPLSHADVTPSGSGRRGRRRPPG